MLRRVLPAHSPKAPESRTLIERVLADVGVNLPFMWPALALFDRDQSFPWAASPARAQRVADWLRKRSELQRGLRLRTAVPRMLGRCYGIFCDPAHSVTSTGILASKCSSFFFSFFFFFTINLHRTHILMTITCSGRYVYFVSVLRRSATSFILVLFFMWRQLIFMFMSILLHIKNQSLSCQCDRLFFNWGPWQEHDGIKHIHIYIM